MWVGAAGFERGCWLDRSCRDESFLVVAGNQCDGVESGDVGVDEYFVVGFNRQPQLLADWTNNEMSVANAVTLLEQKGPTALYDACYLSAEKLAQAKHQKQVLVLITDGGGDSVSKHKLKELQQL